MLDQILKKQFEKMYQWVEYHSLQKKSGKVFKNGPSKICGSQPLKNLKWFGLLRKIISLQTFYRLSSTNFTWPIFEYLDLIVPHFIFCTSLLPSTFKQVLFWKQKVLFLFSMSLTYWLHVPSKLLGISILTKLVILINYSTVFKNFIYIFRYFFFFQYFKNDSISIPLWKAALSWEIVNIYTKTR